MTKLNKAFSVVRALQTSSKFLLGAFIISISSFIYVALAAPPDSPYNLGETLAPTCAPGDANCTVDTPQEGHNYLTDIAGIVANQGDIIYFNGIDWVDLGVGTSGQFLKTQGASANPVWDSIGGGGDLLSANNLSDLDDAGIARTNLGLAIGTDVQAYNNNLNDIAILTPTSDYLMIGDGTDWTTVNTANWDKDNTDDLDINSLTVESTIADTDTLAIYDTSASAIRKITRANFLSGVTGALTYQGSWNASTNSPTLADGTGTQGQYYVVTTAGSRDLGSGSISFTIGDWIIHNGSEWEKLDSTNDVQSVFGRTGIITSANGDYSASQITNTAAGTISATTIQDAINELDSEKQGIDAQLTDIAGLTPTDSYFIVGNGSNFVTESGTTLRTSIGLGDVENTALSTWAGTSNVTTLGTIATGTWQGTSINATYLDGQSGTNTGDETVASIGSLINGATGKITPVDADYVGLMDSAASNVLKKLSWSNVKATLKTYFDTLYQTALTFGISDNNAVEIDSNSVADDEYARFTANGLESRSTAELLADINPMTAAGDIIYGGTSGLQTRLPKGTANQVLTMNAGATAPEWATSTSSEYSDGGENGGADRTLGNKDNYDLGFLTNNINRLHIQNDGNIGIGTNAPSIDLAIGDTDTGLEQVSDGVLTIKTNNDERVRFDASGNVGIGTNEPNSALEVIVADDTTPHGIANINNSLLINTNGNSVDSGASISLGCALGGYDKPTATIKAGATGGNAGYLDFMT
ncbi:MAG: hypothetical protein U9O94_06950, partial [Nanoarchaeota archaeon]|nr:hypothetical protein [Nanoarchaeota archaeon]